MAISVFWASPSGIFKNLVSLPTILVLRYVATGFDELPSTKLNYKMLRFFFLLILGCWQNPYTSECENKECISTHSPREDDNIFCCCRGNNCNKNVVKNYIPPTSTQTDISYPPGKIPGQFVLTDERYS